MSKPRKRLKRSEGKSIPGRGLVEAASSCVGAVIETSQSLLTLRQSLFKDGRPTMKKTDKAITFLAVLAATVPLAKAVWDVVSGSTQRVFTLFFPDETEASETLLSWIEANTIETEERSGAYVVRMGIARRLGIEEPAEAEWTLRSESSRILKFEGEFLNVERISHFTGSSPGDGAAPPPMGVIEGRGGMISKMRPGYTIKFPIEDPDLMNRFMMALGEQLLANSQQGRQPKYVHTWSWSWMRTCKIQEAPCVCLPEGVLESLEQDMQRFFSSKDDYVRLGLPYRRGYLLTGVPRSGKTATIRYLANKMDRGLYLLNLSGADTDRVRDSLSEVPEGSIIVIEDLDSALLDLQGNQKAGGGAIGLDFLLNTLDGLATQPGQVIVITANETVKIDEKLLMKGRIDMRVEFTKAVPEQIRRFGEMLGLETEDIDQCVIDFGDGTHVMADAQERYVEIYFRDKYENENKAERSNEMGDSGHRVHHRISCGNSGQGGARPPSRCVEPIR